MKHPDLRRLVETIGAEEFRQRSANRDWAERRLQLAQRRLDEFFERTGRSHDWYDEGEPKLTPDHPEIVEYNQLCAERFIAVAWVAFFDGYFNLLPTLEARLAEGKSEQSVRSAHTRELKRLQDQLQINLADVAIACAMDDLFSTKQTWDSTIDPDEVQALATKKLSGGDLALFPEHT
jgi:hypothetical protein